AACLLPLGGALLLQYVAGAARDRVEALYSRALYPKLAALLTAATGRLPFALADALAPAALALLVVLAALATRSFRAGRRRTPRLAASAVVAGAGLVYLAFLLLWGLNYRRQPLARTLGLEPLPAPAAELADLAQALAADADALRRGRSEVAGVFRLEGGVAQVLRRAPRGFESFATPSLPSAARPKGSLSSPLLSRLGISGIFIPFTAEPLVNVFVPEVEIPFNASHELAHLAGWAREDEASFVAFVACHRHPDPDFRYSGALVAGLHAVAALASVDRESARRIAESRSPGVSRDVAAIRAFRLEYEGRLTRIGDRVNDAYLRSQGDPRGLQSYGRMVDLLLAARRSGRLGRIAP
ncbi:MAG TPA: DUF3810 family protein, partial [Vicinamibacteria bacterium]|nr:DUF3810 family protein [Vicinamibacteria bacterium]